MSMYDTFGYPEVTAAVAREMGLKGDEYDLAQKILGRNPNYIEIGVISSMFSEHCSYKSSKIHLRKFPTQAPWVVIGPGENAGVIRVDGELCVCFKVESHNHPSFIEPYQGAATGVGGILRDVFTMGARPVAAMNSLRFGPIKEAKQRQLFEGVVSGIAGYGNCFGVPTVGGEVFFHESYAGNPLVNAFALGTVKESQIYTASASGIGNPVIYVGAKTGRDGIHGATMASEEFNEDSESKRPNVQIGDPFKEKLLLEACLELMKTDYVVGIQDMGAAGLTSSSFEMAGRAGSGVEMYLDQVPMREEGMTPYELMLSESQERMLIVAKKGCEDKIVEIFAKWDLDCSVIGKVTDDGNVRLFWKGEEVACMPAAPLSDKAPMYDRPYSRPAWLDDVAKADLSGVPVPADLTATLKTLLADPTIASKRWVWEQYDHMVRVGTVTLPGSDAAVLRLPETQKGVALSSDCNSRLVYLNPREGGKTALVESARNVAASGARPRAFTNCLNFGNPEKPEIMYQFVQAVEGLAEAAEYLETPVVSGNVSLYNETEGKGVYPTPTIVMVGVIDDVEKRITASFKECGSHIIVVGSAPAGIGASQYLYTIHGKETGAVPQIDLAFEKSLINFMVEAADKQVVSAAHDTAEGGLAVALAEMGIANKIGCSVELPGEGRADSLLFGEGGRMVLEVLGTNLDTVQKMLTAHNLPFTVIGTTQAGNVTLKKDGAVLVDVSIREAADIHQNTIGDWMK